MVTRHKKNPPVGRKWHGLLISLPLWFYLMDLPMGRLIAPIAASYVRVVPKLGVIKKNQDETVKNLQRYKVFGAKHVNKSMIGDFTMSETDFSLDRINLLDFWPSNIMLDVWEEGMIDIMNEVGVLVKEGEDEIVIMDRYNDLLHVRLEELRQKAEAEYLAPKNVPLEHILNYFEFSRKAFYERFIFLHSLAYCASFSFISRPDPAAEASHTLKLFNAHLGHCKWLFEHSIRALELTIGVTSERLNSSEENKIVWLRDTIDCYEE